MKPFFLITCVILCLNIKNSLAQSSTIEWQRTFGGSEWDFGKDIQQTNDGGYIILSDVRSIDGDVHSPIGNTDIWVAKLNSSGEITWQRTIGTTGIDYGESIQQTVDGGYIVAARAGALNTDCTGNNGELGFWIIKLNSAGVIQWEKTFGGTGNDNVSDIQQTNDGGYIVTGSSNSIDGHTSGNHGADDIWVLKLDHIGDLIWQKMIGGTEKDSPNSIQQTQDGGYVIAGYSYSNDADVSSNHGNADYLVVKLDNNGNLIWDKSLGGSQSDQALSIIQTSDGSYVVSGFTLSHDGDVSESFGDKDAWTVKLNPSGNIVWERTLGDENWNELHSILETSDGRIILAGETNADSGFMNAWVTILSSEGNQLAENQLGGSKSDNATAIDITPDGSIILIGTTASDDGDITETNGLSDIWVVKFGATLSLPTLLNTKKQLVKTVNILGQEITPEYNKVMIEVYSDGSTRKVVNFR